MVLLENLGRKIVLFPFSIFLFSWRMSSFLSLFFLNYFLLYLFVLSLNRIFFLIRLKKRSPSSTRFKVYHTKPVLDFWLPWPTCLHVHSAIAQVPHCPLFSCSSPQLALWSHISWAISSFLRQEFLPVLEKPLTTTMLLPLFPSLCSWEVVFFTCSLIQFVPLHSMW